MLVTWTGLLPPRGRDHVDDDVPVKWMSEVEMTPVRWNELREVQVRSVLMDRKGCVGNCTVISVLSACRPGSRGKSSTSAVMVTPEELMLPFHVI